MSGKIEDTIQKMAVSMLHSSMRGTRVNDTTEQIEAAIDNGDIESTKRLETGGGDWILRLFTWPRKNLEVVQVQQPDKVIWYVVPAMAESKLTFKTWYSLDAELKVALEEHGITVHDE